MENQKYRLTKLSDDRFDGLHPNGINKGYTKNGNRIHPEKPTKGKIFWLDNMNTSVVTEEMNDDGIFKTRNSTYKLEIL